MGFSASAAFAIIGVCMVICMDIFFGSVLPSLEDLERSYRELEERAVERANTEIEILSITKSSGNPYNLSIEVKNTGSINLDVKEFSVLINGSLQNFTYSSRYLYPERTILINVTDLSYTGSNRVKIITGNGVSDYDTYNA